MGTGGSDRRAAGEVDDRPDDLLLRDFAPRPALRVPVTAVERPRYPVVDAHAHLGPTPFAGSWPDRPVDELLGELDAAGVEMVVDLDGFWGDRLCAEIARFVGPHPDRFGVFAGGAIVKVKKPSAEQQKHMEEEGATRAAAGVTFEAAGVEIL